MTTIGFPILHTDVPFTISPRQVVFNRFLLFGMGAVIRIVQGKLFQCRKMGLNPIQPRGIRRRPVKLDVVRFRIRLHLGLMMIRRIVQNYMQGFLSRISPPFILNRCIGNCLLRIWWLAESSVIGSEKENPAWKCSEVLKSHTGSRFFILMIKLKTSQAAEITAGRVTVLLRRQISGDISMRSLEFYSFTS